LLKLTCSLWTSRDSNRGRKKEKKKKLNLKKKKRGGEKRKKEGKKNQGLTHEKRQIRGYRRDWGGDKREVANQIFSINQHPKKGKKRKKEGGTRNRKRTPSLALFDRNVKEEAKKV